MNSSIDNVSSRNSSTLKIEINQSTNTRFCNLLAQAVGKEAFKYRVRLGIARTRYTSRSLFSGRQPIASLYLLLSDLVHELLQQVVDLSLRTASS